MATVKKIEKDIIRTKEKIAELQKKLRTLEMQRKEAESLEQRKMQKHLKSQQKISTTERSTSLSVMLTI